MSSQPFAVCARKFVIVFSLACLELTTVECCEVSVTQPWEQYTYVPQDSTVTLNCTVADDRTPAWTIKLSSNETDPVSLQFSLPPIVTTLNSRGFYQMLSEENGTIFLLVNVTTDVNNGTEIQCVYPAQAAAISKTVLIVYEPKVIETKAHDIAVQVANISWNPISIWNNNYTLSVTSSSIPPISHELQTTSFEFTAPPNAPPCEVYNFSVTATPVGATYTGDGCSVPSPVLSKMLPSLPDIMQLESAINCSLERPSSGEGMTMTMAIIPTHHYCADYPVLNYTLVVNNTLVPSDSQSHVISPEIPVTVDTLLENSVYVVKIVAANVVGEVATQYRELYTTDLQSVEVVEMNDMNAFSVHCDYLTGSTAKGCSVVIASESYHVNNITVNLTRDDNATQVVHSTLLTSCYNRVFGFDIESDGSLSTTAVPGNLIFSTSSNGTLQCEAGTEETTIPPAAALPRLLLVLIGLVILIVLLISIIITVLCLCAYKLKKRLKTGEARCTSLPTLTADAVHPQSFVYFREDSMPHYEIPANLSPTLENPEKTIEDDGDYSKTMHFHNRAAVELNKCDLDSEDYAQLQENFYHVLEQGGTTDIAGRPLSDINDYDDPDVSPTAKQSSPTTEQFPVYQEITQFCKH